MDRFHFWALLIMTLLLFLVSLLYLIGKAGKAPQPPLPKDTAKAKEKGKKEWPEWFKILVACLVLIFSMRESIGMALLIFPGPREISGIVMDITNNTGRRASTWNKVHFGEVTVHFIFPHRLKKGEVYTIQYTPFTLRPIGIKKLEEPVK
ncbi:hypothetical protein [Paenibacillus fonticola]|uniref:hypothetical protein n=1 Tax=Paenibacillus fonticola TaxID=379896 RepID=UPI000368E338|nr:hypothetical protein [Paenibacillus fonticola]